MKLDRSTTPPRAWFVSDGDVVFIDQEKVKKCACCDDWFIDDSIECSDIFCSSGCKLKQLEIAAYKYKKS